MAPVSTFGNQMNLTKPTLDDFLAQDFERMLSLIEREYDAADVTNLHKNINYQPLKIVHQLTADENWITTSSASVMFSRLPLSGWFGSKTIYVEDTKEGTKRNSVTTLFGADGQIRAVYESSELTLIRCGLMAVMACDKAFGKDGCSHKVVGLNGAGKVNATIARLLSKLRGVKHFVVNSRTPSKRIHHALADVDCVVTERNAPSRFVESCDIISSATTNCDEEGQLPWTDSRSKLFLSWDTGFGFPMGYRLACHHFSDYPAQLEVVRESEFPFDKRWKTALPLNDLNKDALSAIVSFYGLALADIVVASFVYGKGL